MKAEIRQCTAMNDESTQLKTYRAHQRVTPCLNVPGKQGRLKMHKTIINFKNELNKAE